MDDYFLIQNIIDTHDATTILFNISQTIRERFLFFSESSFLIYTFYIKRSLLVDIGMDMQLTIFCKKRYTDSKMIVLANGYNRRIGD